MQNLTPRVRRVLMPWLVTIVSGILALGLMPLVWWIGCVFSAFRVWFYTGRWLRWADRDGFRAAFGPFPDWTESWVPVVIWIVLFGASIGLMNRYLPKRWWLWAAVVIFLGLWGGSIGLLILDPGGVLDWAMD